MSIIRAPRESHFAIIPNSALEDASLSWAARGLLAYLLSRPDDWTIRASQLIASGPSGRDAVYRMLGELVAAGYAVARTRKRGGGGKFAGTDWIIFDSPHTENPYPANPHTDKPHPANPCPTNTEINNTDFNNTETSSPRARRGSAKSNNSSAAQQLAAALRARGFSPAVVARESTQRLLAGWAGRGVTVDQLRGAMDVADAKCGGRPNSPAYYAWAVDQIVDPGPDAAAAHATATGVGLHAKNYGVGTPLADLPDFLREDSND